MLKNNFKPLFLFILFICLSTVSIHANNSNFENNSNSSPAIEINEECPCPEFMRVVAYCDYDQNWQGIPCEDPCNLPKGQLVDYALETSDDGVNWQLANTLGEVYWFEGNNMVHHGVIVDANLHQNLTHVTLDIYCTDGTLMNCDSIPVDFGCEDPVCEEPEPHFQISNEQTSCTFDSLTQTSTCAFTYCIDNLSSFPDVSVLWLLKNSGGDVINASTSACFSFTIEDGETFTVELHSFIPGTICYWVSFTDTIECEPCGEGCPPEWVEVDLRSIEIDSTCEFECQNGFPVYSYSQYFFDIYFYYPLSGTWEITVTSLNGTTVVQNPSSPFQYTMECEVYTNDPFCESFANFEIRYFDENGCLTGYRLETLQANHEFCYLQECEGIDGGGEDGLGNNTTRLHQKIYPNPISLSQSPTLKIEYPEKVLNEQLERIELVNLSGEVVKTVVMNDGWNNEINIQGLSTGIYFVKFSNTNKLLQVEKVVVME